MLVSLLALNITANRLTNPLRAHIRASSPTIARQSGDGFENGAVGALAHRLLSENVVSTMLFLRNVASRPLQMGAVAPSSRSLARAMVHHACIRPGDVVLELGGGSGALTREIVARHPNNPLVIFELSAPLAQALAADFPRARVVADSVEALPRRAADLGLSRIDRVVSSVPWALWTLERQTAVLDSFVPLLAHDARFVAVHLMHSKWLGSVAMLDQLLAARFQQVAESDPVWANVPPAYVHIASLPVGRGAAAGTQAQ